MALFMLHTLLTPLSQFACDIKSWRHKLKKHLLATIPPFCGAGMGTDRTTVQRNIEKALENRNFMFHSYDVTIFFFSLFHRLMEPLAAPLWCTGPFCDSGHDRLDP